MLCTLVVDICFFPNVDHIGDATADSWDQIHHRLPEFFGRRLRDCSKPKRRVAIRFWLAACCSLVTLKFLFGRF
jgi:hypothetical protein